MQQFGWGRRDVDVDCWFGKTDKYTWFEGFIFKTPLWYVLIGNIHFQAPPVLGSQMVCDACVRACVCVCCWSLLYSTILRFRADSLHSHVILHEWIAFYSAFLNIHRSGILTALAWLVPHETATVSTRSVYTIQPSTMSLHAKPHT